MDSDPTYLRLDAEQTVLSSPSIEVVVAVGIDRLAEDVFLHEPPTPVELERGIDVIEDALMAAGLTHTERGELATGETLLHTLLGGPPGGTHATLAEVEALFQRLASVSLGGRRLASDPEFTRRAAAAILILRECMHHLGFMGVAIGGP